MQPDSIATDGVTFSRLLPEKADATLWTAGLVRIPAGELTTELQTAWLRGALLAAFGPAQIPSDPSEVTFTYELAATVDDASEVRLTLGDDKGIFGGWFGRFVHGPVDDALFQRVTVALLRVFEETPPADYDATFYERSRLRYGCAGKIPWVGTKKNGKADCHPSPDAPMSRRNARDVFILEIGDDGASPGGAEPEAPHEVSDAEIAAYYAKTAPPGAPPLAAIREHVLRAMLLERNAHRVPRAPLTPLESRAIARAIFDLGNLALFDFVPLARAFTWRFGPEPLDATRGLAKFERLRARVRSVLDGTTPPPVPSPHSTCLPMSAHRALWDEVLTDLDAAIALVADAAREARPFRIRRRVL